MPVDVYAQVNQSLIDKILDVTDFPIVISEKHEKFPGCNREILDGALAKEYDDSEAKEFFKEAFIKVVEQNRGGEDEFLDRIYSFAGRLIQNYKEVIDASAHPDFEGVSEEELTELQKIVDDGIEGIVDNLASTGRGVKLYAWCPDLRVTLNNRPNISINSPNFSISDMEVEVFARGELWARYTWYNCYKFCFKWKKVRKCDEIGSISVSPDIEVGIDVRLSSSGDAVFARPKFTRLRLDYWILRDIPLEKIANAGLAVQSYKIYDAREFVKTLPIINHDLRIRAITLDPLQRGVRIGVEFE